MGIVDTPCYGEGEEQLALEKRIFVGSRIEFEGQATPPNRGCMYVCLFGRKIQRMLCPSMLMTAIWIPILSVYVYMNAKRGSFRYAPAEPGLMNIFVQSHTHTLICEKRKRVREGERSREVDSQSTYCCLVFPHWGWRRLVATKNGNNSNNIEVQCTSCSCCFCCCSYGCSESVYSLLWLYALQLLSLRFCCSWCRLLLLLLLLLPLSGWVGVCVFGWALLWHIAHWHMLEMIRGRRKAYSVLLSATHGVFRPSMRPRQSFGSCGENVFKICRGSDEFWLSTFRNITSLNFPKTKK